MKRLIMGFFGALLLFVSIPLYAGGVTDDNNGSCGDIFISNGKNPGANSEGHWTDISDISELKGDKGDKGDRGLQGIQGRIGQNGNDGIDGLNGIDGINGEKGDQGIQGDKGDIGANGIDGYTPLKEIDYFDGEKGDTGDMGLNGKDVDPEVVNNLTNINNAQNIQLQNHGDRLNNHEKRIGTLEETQFNIEGEVILKQWRRAKLSTYGKYDLRHNRCPEVGLKITFALDDSWEAKEIDKVNAKLSKMELAMNMNGIETEKVVIDDNHFQLRIKNKSSALKVINKL